MLFGVYIYGAYLMLGLQENGCEGKCLWQVLSKSDEKSEIKNLFCKEKPSFDDSIWCDIWYDVLLFDGFVQYGEMDI